MNPYAQYYLHENGSVIYKPHGGVELDSPCVISTWWVTDVGETPATFAEWLQDLYILGANKERIRELADHNNLFKYIPELEPEFERLGVVKKDKENE